MHAVDDTTVKTADDSPNIDVIFSSGNGLATVSYELDPAPVTTIRLI